jgi:hypothetical protein
LDKVIKIIEPAKHFTGFNISLTFICATAVQQQDVRLHSSPTIKVIKRNENKESGVLKNVNKKNYFSSIY